MQRRDFLRAGLAGIGLPPLLRLADQTYPVGHVRRYGAKGDGRTNDTAAFARATSAIAKVGSGQVVADAGTYLIDANIGAGGGIRLPSNCTLQLTKDATLQAIPNALTHYAVVYLEGVTNAHVVGGKIQGERDRHRGTAGEWGMGIWMNGARNCSARNTTISKCWGDGVYVGGVEPVAGRESTDILIDHVWCDENRRQGCSIVAAKGVRVL